MFTEFFSFVEQRHSPVFLQRAIDASGVASGGVYTATGDYPACEMAQLLTEVAARAGASRAALLRTYGEWMFGRYARHFAHVVDGFDDAFDFLACAEQLIHSEVRKLYPDAELPGLEVVTHTPAKLVLIYRSSRCFEDFCEGVIRGCLAYFGARAGIEREDRASEPVSEVVFTIRRDAP